VHGDVVISAVPAVVVRIMGAHRLGFHPKKLIELSSHGYQGSGIRYPHRLNLCGVFRWFLHDDYSAALPGHMWQRMIGKYRRSSGCEPDKGE
jgi:hypothetical protein